MTVKHTPEPWAATTDGSHEVYSEAEYQSVCMVLGTNYAEANARLIAAAPELLIAVQRCLNFIEGAEAESGEKFECGNIARAAVAKAEGRS